ncbi:DNA-binding transcriptional regulator, LysR-type [Escherichia coli]|nr:DNA-binding transcriptional regulator, LysR-type [Escherichia coli]
MANLYDLKKFDLNLLVIFECIYQHLSISKAAESLYITPSAVSQSLQRLRAQFNDPLFIRSGGNDSNLLIVFYVQIMPDDFVMQLHRF